MGERTNKTLLANDLSLNGNCLSGELTRVRVNPVKATL